MHFESNEIKLKELKHLLKAKAVLCPGLTIEFQNENSKDSKIKWFFEDGLKSYLEEESNDVDLILEESILSSNILQYNYPNNHLQQVFQFSTLLV